MTLTVKLVLALIIVAIIVCGVLFARVYQENRRSIDCGMKAGSVAGIALHRDKGATREEARALLSRPGFGDYSAAEIESMLDAVFVHGIGKSFEEIRETAYTQCDENKER